MKEEFKYWGKVNTETIFNKTLELKFIEEKCIGNIT